MVVLEQAYARQTRREKRYHYLGRPILLKVLRPLRSGADALPTDWVVAQTINSNGQHRSTLSEPCISANIVTRKTATASCPSIYAPNSLHTFYCQVRLRVGIGKTGEKKPNALSPYITHCFSPAHQKQTSRVLCPPMLCAGRPWPVGR